MQQYFDMRIALRGQYLGYFKSIVPPPLARAFEYIANLSGYQFNTPDQGLFENPSQPLNE